MSCIVHGHGFLVSLDGEISRILFTRLRFGRIEEVVVTAVFRSDFVVPVQVNELLDCAQSLALLVASFEQLDRLWELDSADILVNIGLLAQVFEVALGNGALLSDSISRLASKRAHKVLLAETVVVHFMVVLVSITTFGGVLDDVTAAVKHCEYVAAVCLGDGPQLFF